MLFRTSKCLGNRSQPLQVFVAYVIEALTCCKVSTAQLSDTASLGSLASSDGQLADSELCSKALLLTACPHSPTHVKITPKARNCHARSPASQSYIACSILYLLCTLKSSLVTILTLTQLNHTLGVPRFACSTKSAFLGSTTTALAILCFCMHGWSYMTGPLCTPPSLLHASTLALWFSNDNRNTLLSSVLHCNSEPRMSSRIKIEILTKPSAMPRYQHC